MQANYICWKLAWLGSICRKAGDLKASWEAREARAYDLGSWKALEGREALALKGLGKP